MSDLKFTSPSDLYLQLASDGTLSLKGYLHHSITNGELSSGYTPFTYSPYFPPNGLWLISPDFEATPTANRVWFLDGSIYTQGTFYKNQTSFSGTLIFKDSVGNTIMSIDDNGDIYLKGDVTNIGSPSAPSYNPNKWNDGDVIQESDNCYNYANDQITYTYAQPGWASDSSFKENLWANFDPEHLWEAAGDDGLEYAGISEPSDPGDGRHIVCLVCDLRNPSPDYRDYHWYRKDSNGYWSHKIGDGEATNLDNSGDPITDPKTCDRGRYTTFGCYMYARGNNAFIR